MKRMKKQRTVRPLRVALIAAAIVVLLTGTALAVVHYTRITDSMESNWNEWAETQMTEEHKDFIEARSAGIGESATDQGITVTIDSVTCTEDTVYLMIDYELDPELYDTENVMTCLNVMTNKYVENEDYGTSEGGSGGGHESGYYFTFEKLPEGARLNDGKTTMHMEMSEIVLLTKDNTEPHVTGTWNFAFLLPESETVEENTSDVVLNFDSGIAMELSGISVKETGCKFSVVTEADNYLFSAGGENAELARAAEPDMMVFTVDVVMADGTKVPSSGSSMDTYEGSNVDEWTIEWSAPLKPADVVSLIFSDGTTEIEVPLQ